MGNRFSILLALVLTPVLAFAQQPVKEPARAQAVPLDSGWQYRTGDSPLGPGGVPAWLNQAESSGEWRDTGVSVTAPEADGHDFVWYRIELPKSSWSSPALYFPSMSGTFEVYLDGTRIYKYGALEWNERNKYTVVTSHLIPLEDGYQGGTMMVRIYLGYPSIIGHPSAEESVWIGSEQALVRRILRRSADSTILGCLFVFVGLFSVLLGRFRERAYFPLSFGAFAIFIGLFYVFSDPLAIFMIKSPVLRLYTRVLSFLVFPVGLYVFLEHIVGPRRIIRLLWLAHAGFAVVAVGLDLLRVLPLGPSLWFYNFFFIGTIVVALYVALKSAIGGNRDARIFLGGLTACGVSGLHDIILGLGGQVFYRDWVSHWGTLGFIIALAYILERRFTENHHRLRRYSSELEDKSEQLEEYSRTLEQKVTERTRDLDIKNEDLERTLGELQRTQRHLIMSEKMASLGSLVAGVAHEINNPVGAVSSASDVSSRCLDRLQESVEQAKSVKAVLRDRNYVTAMKLLRENTKIAREGSGRVTEIVGTLKNFARLDEAEFKEADIHEGLDSTLTLVQHELKNRILVVKEYGDIPAIRCYPNQLNQVFMNLLVNAAQAIEDKGTITIKTGTDNSQVYVSVCDDGKGIPPEYVSKVFDPGFTTKGTGVGTGLGLSISYRIIENHKGHIEAKSREGHGTEFRITLPV